MVSDSVEGKEVLEGAEPVNGARGDTTKPLAVRAIDPSVKRKVMRRASMLCFL
jgi:hypothetical protein